MVNKIKTCSQQQKGANIEEILNECNNLVAGDHKRSMHPVFVELDK
eukprot:CAMPEP_0170559358 /NCGR_PEP_ID=MMETSP0211-20121228/42183_1 /TAXON_ID=311385 /ORGANISM="Pseudokeronopsis sp., Strain OXSARD2" /LENGTH=45 /DNA_ID= /DNA_START= /DNA_END= /DNA_ORIENTATION=